MLGDFVPQTVAQSLAPKWHHSIDFDRLSTPMAPLKHNKNAGKHDVSSVDIVEVTDSSSVPPTRENTGETMKTTER